MVVDQPGVLADVTGDPARTPYPLASMLQHGRKPGEAVPIVLVTHETTKRRRRRARRASPTWNAVLEAR